MVLRHSRSQIGFFISILKGVANFSNTLRSKFSGFAFGFSLVSLAFVLVLLLF